MLFRLRPNPVLVALILDELPAEVWTSTSTVFIDPAMGSGQFVTEIERRLRAHGHDDDNIRARVFGLESNQMDVAIAVNMNGLVGTYRKDANYSAFLSGDLRGLGEDIPVKFDVIVGNPPYQSDDAKVTNGGTNRKLWPLFLAKAFSYLQVKGYLGFVIPNTWCSGAKNPLDSTNIFKDYIKKKNLIWLDTQIKQRCFPDVSIGISAFVLQNTDAHPNSVEINGQKIKNFQSWDFIPKIGDMMSIFDKTMDHEAFDFEMVRTGFSESEMSDVKTREFKFKTYIGTKGFRYIPCDTKYRKDRKVIIHRMTSLIPIVDELGEISPTYSQVYKLRDGELGENFVKLMKSKFYRALNEGARYTQYTESRTLNAFPKVDLSRTWTDAELYQYFNLTQEEIALIERIAK